MRLQELIETKIKILSENKDSNVMNVMVPFIQSDIKNRNGRIYKKSLLQREIARVQNSVKKGSFIGVGDHPASGIENIATASHIVTALSLDEKGQGTAELRILPTSRGKTIQTLIHNNATLGVSIRGFGEVGKDGMVQNNYKLMGLDIVTNPSFKDAVFNKSNIFESVEFSEENEVQKDLEEAINDLEKQSFFGAVESGYKGTEEEFSAQYGGKLREMVGLPATSDGLNAVKKLTEAQVNARTYTYYREAVNGGFIGTFDEWKEKFPQIVEQAKEKKVVLSEKKEEIKEPFKSRTSWNEVIASGFHGTMQEYQEQFPDIELIAPVSPQKPIVEKTLTLKEQAAKIFTSLAKDNPNSQLVLEDIIAFLEKKEIAEADKRLRKRAIYIVNTSLAGSGSVPDKEMLLKMVEDEIENQKKLRQERRDRNWAAYEKLLD